VAVEEGEDIIVEAGIDEVEGEVELVAVSGLVIVDRFLIGVVNAVERDAGTINSGNLAIALNTRRYPPNSDTLHSSCAG
jgi:hypothetical protein